MSTPAKHIPASAAQADETPLRFVTAASLFDGHDAAINIMRRIIQAQGAEVIHLGHNRSVEDVVRAALQEDADAIAMSSYQGGHVEYFKYMVDMLKERGAEHIRVFGGGGGTITPEEIARAAGLRRRAHLPPQRRHAPGPDGHDRGRHAAHQARHGTSARARDASDAHADVEPGRRDQHRRTCSSAWRTARWPRPSCRSLRKEWQLAGRHDPGARPHRHRRRRQVLGGRRTAAALPARLPRDAHRRAGGGPHAPALRRRAAGRPHPHEQPALPPRVHALHGHAPRPRGHQHGADTTASRSSSASPTTWSSSRPPASASPTRRSSTWSTSPCT